MENGHFFLAYSKDDRLEGISSFLKPDGVEQLMSIRSQQRIQISGCHISIDVVIKDKIFNTQIIVYLIEIFQLKKNVL